MLRKIAFCIASAVLLLLGALEGYDGAGAVPSLQLPWPTGEQHRINGGWTYGCPSGYPYYGTHDTFTATSPGAYNADYYAIDFQFGLTNPVSAAASGTVIVRGYDDGYGNKVVLDHDGGYTSTYAHLDSFAVDLVVHCFACCFLVLTRERDFSFCPLFSLDF